MSEDLVLVAGSATVTVAPARGGAIESFTVGGLELLGGMEPIDGAPARFYAGWFPLAPFAGLLRTDAGPVAGIAENTWRGAEHGTVFDAVWQVTGRTEATARMRTSLGDGWPFAGSAELEIELTPAALTVVLRVLADEDMPLALGHHPWFRRVLGSSPARLEVRPTGAHVFDAGRMATPVVGRVPDRPWDHVLTGVTDAPTISWPELVIRLTSPTTTWVVFEQQPDAFCVEPVTAPAGAIAIGGEVLGAGRTRELPLTISWDRP